MNRLSDALESDMAKIGVRNVADEDPSHFEYTLPFVGSPHGAAAGVVHLTTRSTRGDTWKLIALTGVNISAMPQKWPLEGNRRKRPYHHHAPEKRTWH